MPSTANVTTNLVRSLDDPSKWEKVEGVPVFMAHEREFPEVRDAAGKVIAPKRTVRVSDQDLYGIADRLNEEIRTTGHLRPLTVGHRNFAPGFPERDQPTLVGVARNYTVQLVRNEGGSFLALCEDEYVMRPHVNALQQYPYRSIDYNPDSKLSEGTALLIRPPFLKMGTTIVYQYEAPPMSTPTDDDFSPQEIEAYERCMKYLRKMKYLGDTTDSQSVDFSSGVAERLKNGMILNQQPDSHEKTMAYMASMHRAGRSCSYEDAKVAVLSDRRPTDPRIVALATYQATGNLMATPPMHQAVMERMYREIAAGRSCGYEHARGLVLTGR